MVRDREDPGTLPLQGLPMRLERVQRCLRSLHQRRFIYAMQEESFFFEQSVLVSKANRISHQEDPERNRRKVPETTTWS